MMTKRSISLLLALAMLCVTLLGTIPVASAAEVLASGKAGENITWTAYDDGRMVFSGTGRMKNVDPYASFPWEEYGIYDAEHLIFEEGITYIGAYAFYDYSGHNQIKTITFPSSLTEIGDDAFVGLPKLEAVYITDLKSWCSISFYATGSNPLLSQADLYLNGEKVVDLVIPGDIASICSYAFMGCTSLRSVTIPAHVTSIGSFAFNSCYNLKQMIFQGNPPSFGQHVFTLSNLTAYYPTGNSAWNDTVFQQLDSSVTWEPDRVAPFTDVASYSWYGNAVKWAIGQSITTGVTATTFVPNAACTRGQIVTFLWRAAGCPEPVLRLAGR